MKEEIKKMLQEILQEYVADTDRRTVSNPLGLDKREPPSFIDFIDWLNSPSNEK